MGEGGDSDRSVAEVLPVDDGTGWAGRRRSS